MLLNKKRKIMLAGPSRVVARAQALFPELPREAVSSLVQFRLKNEVRPDIYGAIFEYLMPELIKWRLLEHDVRDNLDDVVPGYAVLEMWAREGVPGAWRELLVRGASLVTTVGPKLYSVEDEIEEEVEPGPWFNVEAVVEMLKYEGRQVYHKDYLFVSDIVMESAKAFSAWVIVKTKVECDAKLTWGLRTDSLGLECVDNGAMVSLNAHADRLKKCDRRVRKVAFLLSAMVPVLRASFFGHPTFDRQLLTELWSYFLVKV